MKAMILAAGYGTRLQPLTDNKPKALVEINGIPMLEILIHRLIKANFREIIINVHHKADMITEFLQARNNFDIRIEISQEEEILGTGGGLKNAAYFFDDDEPFLMHNVDVISNIDLREMLELHRGSRNIATLAVMKRATSRCFLVGNDNLIYGHVNKKKKKTRLAKPAPDKTEELAFSGIHVISPDMLSQLSENGFFSIIDIYLRLITTGHHIGVYRIDGHYWKDLGKPDHIRQVEADLRQGKIVF
ncbi:NTP transferase domain-containing protein [candidate division KSB1 bacterium]|nr:NTP transferase domain-containing protein [candidate division KSB1 bacterium]